MKDGLRSGTGSHDQTRPGLPRFSVARSPWEVTVLCTQVQLVKPGLLHQFIPSL